MSQKLNDYKKIKILLKSFKSYKALSSVLHSILKLFHALKCMYKKCMAQYEFFCAH